MKDKILVVNDGFCCGESYYKPFDMFGELEYDVKVLDSDPTSVKLVVFTGGEDVTPSFYNEEANPKTYNSPARDRFEAKVFEKALQNNLPMAGICRGSQFLCVMAGGKLIQHLNNHGGYHEVVTNEDLGSRVLTVTSTHHQNQLPPEGAVPLAWASPRRSDVYEGPPGVNYEPEHEYDCVYYPNINAVGMQYHPEFMPRDSDGFKFCEELVRKYLLPEAE